MTDQKNISVIVDAHVLDKGFQGTRSFITNIYKLLIKHPEIRFYIAARNIENLQFIFGNHENINYLGLKSINSYERLVLEIPRLIKKHRIDYAHFQYICPPIKYCKYIVTTHDVIFEDLPDEFSCLYRRIKKHLYKRSAAMADVLTTVSQFSKRSIHKHLNIPLHRIHVVPNGIEDTFFDLVSREEASQKIYNSYAIENFILFVSRLEPRKNHHRLLEAYDRLKLCRKGISLVFIGNRTLNTPALQRKMNSLDHETRNHIIQLENITQDDVKLFYKAARLFVYPSKGEGFGIPPLEAVASGTPVICSDAMATGEYKFLGPDLVNIHQQNSLEERMMEHINNPLSDKILKERADYVRKTYSWQKSADILYDLLMENHQKEIANDQLQNAGEPEGRIAAGILNR